MPIDKEELDKVVDLATKVVFDKMEAGKFYSTNEISEMLVKKQLFTKDALKEYIPSEFIGKGVVPISEALTAFVIALRFYLWDVSYVEAFLWSQVAVGKLEVGLKDGLPHYAKK